uniref:NADH:ubiquinone reductase (H(+)-translocating) n=1 Tax=Aplysina gerardogreeni TaxID=1171991 RepID=A0A7T8V7V4_9METZ|nr:NADH dehydrogenase subunit 2 [Aplysina gerardogreeni]QQQ89096.1 NADH dehydrogenase subunit 2 [Aplysina gerardogreeni]
MFEIYNIILYPEILLSIIILGLVIYGIKLSTFKVSISFLFIVGVLVCFHPSNNIFNIQAFDALQLSNGLLSINNWMVIIKLIIIIGSISILLISSLEDKTSPVLILIVTLSSLLLVSSINWLSLYLTLELQTLSLFILVALKRDSAYGTEAGLKFFVLGALSSGLFLFGCALLYGLTGETSIQGISQGANIINYEENLLLLSGEVGKIFITISLLFKLSAAPFHMWAPDVYEGAPVTITALLATIPKIAGFAILVQIGPIVNVILICAVLSIIYGSIGALNQTKIMRLFAYSGISHIGFILFGIAIGSFEGLQASLIYMIIYILMSICSFSIILSLNLYKGLLVELGGLSRDNPVLSITLTLTFLSIAGIPPLAGFFSKWLILLSGISAGYYLISLIIVICSVIAGVYYVRIVKIIKFQTGYPLLIWQKVLNKRKDQLDFKKSLLIGVSFFFILFLMIYPNFLLQLTYDATISIY